MGRHFPCSCGFDHAEPTSYDVETHISRDKFMLMSGEQYLNSLRDGRRIYVGK
jgi:hypothetical protein